MQLLILIVEGIVPHWFEGKLAFEYGGLLHSHDHLVSYLPSRYHFFICEVQAYFYFQLCVLDDRYIKEGFFLLLLNKQTFRLVAINNLSEILGVVEKELYPEHKHVLVKLRVDLLRS